MYLVKVISVALDPSGRGRSKQHRLAVVQSLWQISKGRFLIIPIAISRLQSTQKKADRWNVSCTILDYLWYTSLICLDSHVHGNDSSLWVVHEISTRFTPIWSALSSISSASIHLLATSLPLHLTTRLFLSVSFLVVRIVALDSFASVGGRRRSDFDPKGPLGIQDPSPLNFHRFYVRRWRRRGGGARGATDEFER